MSTGMNLTPDLHAGTLSDTHIRQACGTGWLISANFDNASVHQACYELRAGNIYYELDKVDANTTPTRHELKNGEYILLKPKQIVTVITHETLRLPDNVLGRVLTKGQLFSIGILPVNTYADPGFEGRLGIVLVNVSNNYIKIEQGQPIAKIEFSKLRQPVTAPYTGQHGYQTSMWPIPHHLLLSDEEAKKDARVLSDIEELELSHGKNIARIAKRVFRFERFLLLSAGMYFLLATTVIAWLACTGQEATLTLLTSVILGVVSNLVFAVMTYFATKLSR